MLLRQGGEASLSVDFAADEVALLGKVVVERGVDGREFLQRLHPLEPDDGSLASPERQVAVLSPVVLPATYRRLPALGVQRRAIGPQTTSRITSGDESNQRNGSEDFAMPITYPGPVIRC